MYLVQKTLDDILFELYPKVLEAPTNESQRGSNQEILGVHLVLTNPRSRLSRTEIRGNLFSALGEFLWYMRGSDLLEIIKYYIPKYEEESEDGKTIFGAYGPRLFNWGGEINQVSNALKLLRDRPTTRRCVIQIYEPKDISKNYKEIPCTENFQFFIRESKLHMHVNMRSNDLYLGLPHDVFTFTLFQEYFAAKLGLELGRYHHNIASAHIYKRNIGTAKFYTKEGVQSTLKFMNPMPKERIEENIKLLLESEKDLRNGCFSRTYKFSSDYWKDLFLCLKFYAFYKAEKIEMMKIIREEITDNYLTMYLTKQVDKLQYD